MYLPISTYRLQFSKDFTFNNLNHIISFLNTLGAGSIYASPVFCAVPGSSHGYDITDPVHINPEIGTHEELTKIIRDLQEKGIGWIQDIVPNHMAFHQDNYWLMDVLKLGRKSDYAAFFDIHWDHPLYRNKLMVPILNDSVENIIQKRQLTLISNRDDFFLLYNDFKLPVNPDSFNNKTRNIIDADKLCIKINSDPTLLQELLLKQHYILTPWQDVDIALNYRRFFTINGLISLKMEETEVFEKYHELIFRMTDEGMFNGIRLDHVDGLKKPVEYFSRLRLRTGNQTYIIAEKILEANENLDSYWPLQGTTGYDFIALINALFTGSGVNKIIAFYKKRVGISFEPDDVIYSKKLTLLNESFAGDLDNIYRLLITSGLIRISSLNTEETIREALGEFIVCCPVYKLYVDTFPLGESDQKLIISIVDLAIRKKPHLKTSLLAIKKLFTTDNDNHIATELFLRLMQLTGPLMAKGIEDTAMYYWVALLARNEVGDSINAPVVPIPEFHNKMIERRNLLPATINATATHDTKRGEDSRSRLVVLSDMPEDWIRYYIEWSKTVRKYLIRIRGITVPDENEKYFICQVILGALPMNGMPDVLFFSRIEEYLRKALREAKIHTSWSKPDLEYENAVIKFLIDILNDKDLNEITLRFFLKLREYGIINSLSQLVLKTMCPGIPDFYQGTELWDLSFVDPDNRRQVDYSLRESMLNKLLAEMKKPDFFEKLYMSRFQGEIKLWMMNRLLHERLSDPDAFVNAGYYPLEVTGTNSKNLLAFARVYNEKWYVVIVPLHLATIHKDPALHNIFNNTFIIIPDHAPKEWESVWDNRSFKANDNYIEGSLIQFNFPLVIKGLVKKNRRGSGILFHITSLPGNYGIGSLGKEAQHFVRLLKKAGQKYWQILPINPPGLNYSPYSSISAFAGNWLLIDPELLLDHHYINKLPDAFRSSVIDFKKAAALRTKLFSEAFVKFRRENNILLKHKFEEFCNDNQYWLDDYSLFTLFQAKYGYKWNTWPSYEKNRDEVTLKKYLNTFKEDIGLTKFIQYIFHEQFTLLKSFAKSYGIEIIGDIPIYIAYDSADVWSHPEVFNLNNNGKMITVSGVPPDFFSTTGQLWNMPVYNWKVLKANNYDWWKKRVKRTLEYCDILRLDHFRALSAYWEVPYGEKTAQNGKWTKGPGKDFFNALKHDLAELPFIAEDLGEIDKDVLKLRDDYRLPGMKVIMFAFEEEMPDSFHLPHNYQNNSIVYTGTHDNNTVRGWYDRADKNLKVRLSSYLWKRTTSTSIAWDMIRLATTSVSEIAIIPVQDLLGLDESARMNTPGKSKGNWKWRLADFKDLDRPLDQLSKLCYYSGRI